MSTLKLHPGNSFPLICANSLTEVNQNISRPSAEYDWRMLIVYRGRHCPLCTRFLNELNQFRNRLYEINIDLVAVSADSREQYEEHSSRLEVAFPIYHGLTMRQMTELGLFISKPRSEQETDHNFSEPGLFIINESDTLQVVDISNNPFVRPDLENLISGLEWIRKNDYPIRGTCN